MTVTRKTPPIDPARFRPRATSWEGLIPGDRFRVTGKQGEFKFKAAVLRNDKVDHIECFGTGHGVANKVQCYAFQPERIIIPTDKELAKQRRTREDPAAP